MNYPNNSQLLPENKKITFSKANLSLYDYGCAIMSLCNLLNFYGKVITPIQLKDQLKFDNNGCVYWASLTEIFKDIVFRTKYDWSNEKAKLEIINNYLKNEQPLIVSTMTGKGRKMEHFITLWAKENNDYVCSCPLKGQINFSKVYGDPARWIYKVIVYEKIQDPREKIKELLNNAFGFLGNLNETLKKISVSV